MLVYHFPPPKLSSIIVMIIVCKYIRSFRTHKIFLKYNTKYKFLTTALKCKRLNVNQILRFNILSEMKNIFTNLYV